MGRPELTQRRSTLPELFQQGRVAQATAARRAPERRIMKIMALCIVTTCLLPAAASASSGTLVFQGALVEPTCQTEVLDAQPRPGQLAVRLYDCQVSFVEALRGQTTASGPHSRQLQTLTLSEPVAALVGRDRVELVTLSYL